MKCTCHERGEFTANICPVHGYLQHQPGVANPVENAINALDNISDEIGITHEYAEGFVVDS